MLEDEFGDVIAKARRGLGLSADETAARAGISADLLGKLEAYKADPTSEQVKRLSEVLALRAVPLDELGSKAWEPDPVGETVGPWRVRMMTLRHLTGFTSNTYLLWKVGTFDAVIVDPGFQPAKIREALLSLGLTARLVAVTHGHHDHVGAALRMAMETGAPIVLGKQDFDLVSGASKEGRFRSIDGGERFPVGDWELEALAAPGHTAGGRCYVVPGVCFVGDTLFAASIGRTFGGPPDYPIHLATIRGRILGLPAATKLFPGHGPPTSVAEEREHNPFS